MKFKKLLSVISVVLCVILLTNISALAVKPQPASVVKSISIFPMYGVVEGEVRQMQATVDAGDSFLSAVEWSSSNPKAISCTEDGKIKGLVAGESATITCKAKWGSVNDKIKVYCVKKVSPTVKCKLNGIFIYTLAQPAQGKWSRVIWNISSFIYMILSLVKKAANASVSSMALPYLTTDSKVTVYGRVKEYAYVRFGESDMFDGFINYKFLPENTNAFLNLSAEDMDVWANGITYENRKLTTPYKGTVDWTVENNKYISFDETTGQITGNTEGVGKTVKITAKADGMSETCTIHLLYKWEQAWTSKTNKETYLYQAEGTDYTKGNILAKGKEFVVQGDCGTNSGWAYGYCKINGENRWGYVPIADVSTKGTVSYYNSLNWEWPLQNKNYNYINSPYSPRPAYNDLHRGFDINEKEGQADIEGKALVAPFDGVVKRVGSDLDKTKGCGNYICITSKTVDPVTGKNLIAIYQHMKLPALFSDTDEVKKGEIIGYAGDTGRSGGSHLHFEVNNWNAGIGDSGRSDFTYTINPIYFYMDMVKNNELVFNMGCSSVSSGYSFYFYNYDK